MSSNPYSELARASEPSGPNSGNALLLTGATGFVGMAVLARILERTDRHVVVLVRAASQSEADGRLEALNSKARLLSHRAYGFHSANALIAMIYLCCTGIQIALPHR